MRWSGRMQECKNWQAIKKNTVCYAVFCWDKKNSKQFFSQHKTLWNDCGYDSSTVDEGNYHGTVGESKISTCPKIKDQLQSWSNISGNHSEYTCPVNVSYFYFLLYNVNVSKWVQKGRNTVGDNKQANEGVEGCASVFWSKWIDL